MHFLLLLFLTVYKAETGIDENKSNKKKGRKRQTKKEDKAKQMLSRQKMWPLLV